MDNDDETAFTEITVESISRNFSSFGFYHHGFVDSVITLLPKVDLFDQWVLK